MRRVFRFEGEQREGGDEQRQRGVACRKKIQCEQREKNGDDADHAGNHRSGMIQLGENRQRAEREKQKGDVRIHQHRQNPLFQRHVVRPDWTGEMQCEDLAVVPLDRFSLGSLQQRREIRRDEVDQMLLQRFVFSE